jgi:hypothetical protein
MAGAVHIRVVIIGLIVALVATVAARTVMTVFTVTTSPRVESDDLGGRASLAERCWVAALGARRDRLRGAVTVDRNDQWRSSRMKGRGPGDIPIAGRPSEDQQTREQHSGQL